MFRVLLGHFGRMACVLHKSVGWIEAQLQFPILHSGGVSQVTMIRFTRNFELGTDLTRKNTPSLREIACAFAQDTTILLYFYHESVEYSILLYFEACGGGSNVRRVRRRQRCASLPRAFHRGSPARSSQSVAYCDFHFSITLVGLVYGFTMLGPLQY